MTISEQIIIVATCKTKACDIISSMENTLGVDAAFPATIRALGLFIELERIERSLSGVAALAGGRDR